jgi:hypothetical protein
MMRLAFSATMLMLLLVMTSFRASAQDGCHYVAPLPDHSPINWVGVWKSMQRDENNRWVVTYTELMGNCRYRAVLVYNNGEKLLTNWGTYRVDYKSTYSHEWSAKDKADAEQIIKSGQNAYKHGTWVAPLPDRGCGQNCQTGKLIYKVRGSFPEGSYKQKEYVFEFEQLARTGAIRIVSGKGVVPGWIELKVSGPGPYEALSYPFPGNWPPHGFDN